MERKAQVSSIALLATRLIEAFAAAKVKGEHCEKDCRLHDCIVVGLGWLQPESVDSP